MMEGNRPSVENHDGPNGKASGVRTWRVLLVEDDAIAAEGLAGLLRRDGYEVRIVGDGPSALQTAEADVPDVVLLDLGLPGMDGYEVARGLRAQKTAKRPLLIAVTGYGERDERVRSYEVGMDLHLTKPVSVGELRGFLERYQAVARPAGSPPPA
jgi:CheY-like chemotaxis protein